MKPLWILILILGEVAMTKEETIKLFLIIKGSYPNHFKTTDEITFKLTSEMWFSAFKDQTYQTVLKVTQKYILEHVYPPTIAELREEVVKITNPNALISPENAWESVILAIKRYGYYRQSEALQTFSEPIKRAVRAIGWGNICKSENIGIERANFFKFYNALGKQDREQAIIPSDIYKKLQEITNKKALEHGNNEMSKMQ